MPNSSRKILSSVNYVDLSISPEAGISRVNISRQVDRIEIEFFTARPRALVGAKGETLTQRTRSD